jgi:energy-coupling factor transporter ATP-binding protein EcfA2
MDLIHEGEYSLTNLSKINILLGKNGSGKSRLLKKVEIRLSEQNNGEVNYVTPERGGVLSYDAGVEQNRSNNENYILNKKRQNQWTQFKAYTISQFRRLELLSLREIEQDHDIRQDLTHSFDTIIQKINKLLTNVRIERTKKGDFEIFHSESNSKLNPDQISSGESELIALTIECLTFAKSCSNEEENYLFLDEPDVHLHPDLQAKFIEFLISLMDDYDFSIVIATHSTAILGALLDYCNSRFAILENGSTEPVFREITEMYKDILPIFGAHPLSNLFNQNPVVLLEGEDDVRIFQQAIRTGNGELKLYPCSVDGVGNLPEYEKAVIEIINGVYDTATAYSLRDRDEGEDSIEDLPPLIRFVTSCRNAENLILTDEVLENLGTNWHEITEAMENWIENFEGHAKYDEMLNFKNSEYDRKNHDLKDIRNILVGLTPSAKPWEIAVGQVIGKIANNSIALDHSQNKICNFLGNKLVEFIAP